MEAYKRKLKQFEKASQKQAMENLELSSLNPNVCHAVRPLEPTTINILNEPLRKHRDHPINKFLKLANDFCYLSLVKASNQKGNP